MLKKIPLEKRCLEMRLIEQFLEHFNRCLPYEGDNGKGVYSSAM